MGPSSSFAAAAAASVSASEEEYHYDSVSAPAVNFIQQITGALYPKTWDELTDQEQKKVLAVLFEEGIHSKTVLFSTLVTLDYISKKGATPPFTTTTTAVELDEWVDDWKVGESRILCLTSTCTTTWAQLYSLEFVSQETGSVCTLEVQHDFNFRYSIPDNQFIVLDRKLKDKCKRLVFSTLSNDKLVDFVETLNRSLSTIMNSYTQRKLSNDNGAAAPTTPPIQYNPADPSPSSPGAQGHEPMTAKRIIEIIRKLFERKEEGAKEKRTGKLKKIDISGPTDFRHVQHFGPTDSMRSNEGILIVNNVQDLLQVPSTSNGTPAPANTCNDNPNTPDSTSPTHDKKTLSFIYDVIEECNNDAPPPPRSALRTENRHTIQIPQDLTDSEIRSLLNSKDLEKSQSFGGNHNRIKIIQDLKIHMEDEETRTIILQFVESFKKDADSEREQNHEETGPEPSSSADTNISTISHGAKWTSGRKSAPPPPKSPSSLVTAANISDNDNDDALQSVVDESSFNFSAVRNSIRAELSQNLDSQFKPGFQEKGNAALLRSNTWSTNQVKEPGIGFNTLPSTKPSLKLNPVKKTNSEYKRRLPKIRPPSMTPPPPPTTQPPETNDGAAETVSFGNGNRSTPEREPEPMPVPVEPYAVSVPKKPPPPIPKPRTSKMMMPMRRINSNPSDGYEEPRYANIQISRSFDTESGVGVAPAQVPDCDSDSVFIFPARPAVPVPPTANTQLVAELRERIDGIKQ
jgi:hypothetical protein